MRNSILSSVATCAIAAVPFSVQAQATPGPSAGNKVLNTAALEDIIVTAQKREQNAQNIGIAITAVTGTSLQALGNRDITALARQVPSLQVTQYSTTQTVFNIRGVALTDVADGHEAPIAFYNDEVYVSAPGAVSGQNFDLQRVEVLRGPQGTLFGRNATGGLVQMVTAKPSNTLEGFATFKAGERGLLAGEAAVSGPLTDTIRGRLSFTANYNDGYIKNVTIGGPKGNNSKFIGVRGQLETDVGNGILRLKGEYLRNDHETSYYTEEVTYPNADKLGVALPNNVDYWSGKFLVGSPFPQVSCPGCDAYGNRAPADKYASASNLPGVIDRTFWSGTVNFQQDLGFSKLTSVTNYQYLSKSYSVDSDMSPQDIFNVISSQKLNQFSEEARLNGDIASLNWTAGIYYLHVKSDNRTLQGTSTNIFQPYANQVYTQKTDSLAAFAQLEYKISSKLSIIGGIRFTHDIKSNNYVRLLQFPFSAPTITSFNTTLYPDLARINYNDYSGKIEVDYRPMDRVLLYASINRGIKSGGFGTQAFTAVFRPNELPYHQEVLTSYEGGFKATVVPGFFTLNVAAFHYHYTGYQTFTYPSPGELVITNQPARITGAEFEASLRPVHGVTLSPYLTYLAEAKVLNIALPSGRLVDSRMPQTPKVSAGTALTIEHQVGKGALRFFTNWKYDSAQYFNAFNSPISREPARLIGDVRISYDTGHGVEMAAFVNNVTDKYYRLFTLDEVNNLGASSTVPAPPRWFGGSITYRFGN